MKLTRLRSGELLATLGAVALVALSFLPWYRASSGALLTAWDNFGVVDVMIVIVVVGALTLAVATITERSPALPVSTAVWITPLALIASLAIFIGLLDKPDHAVALRPASWLSLIAALAVLAGAWQSLRDERTELYQPAEPEPRTPVVPGA